MTSLTANVNISDEARVELAGERLTRGIIKCGYKGDIECIALLQSLLSATGADPVAIQKEVDAGTQPVLCYVEDSWAYFTTRDLKEQWGDDWDDAPYEHNAGPPYGPTWHNEPKHRNNPATKRGWRPGTKTPYDVGEMCQCTSCLRDWNEDGTPKYEIIKVAWDGELNQPCDGCINSHYSVQQINAGAIAWLQAPNYRKGAPIVISAGTTLREFKQLINQAGGNVYE